MDTLFLSFFTNTIITEFIHKFWLPAMHHPSYLQVGGRHVFKIINAPSLYINACNRSTLCVSSMLDELRNSARDAGLGECFENVVLTTIKYLYESILHM